LITFAPPMLFSSRVLSRATVSRMDLYFGSIHVRNFMLAAPMMGTGNSTMSASGGDMRNSTTAMPPTVATTRIIWRISVERNCSSLLMSLLSIDMVAPVW
jgi:hypothetical protein